MKFLVATPSKDHTVFVPFYRSLLRLQKRFLQNHPEVELQFETKSGLLVDAARNFFATWLLLDPSFTHLLFIDADMGFEPELIEKMIAFDKPIVAAMYPIRKRDEKRWLAAARATGDVAIANARASDFVSEGALSVMPVPGTDRRGVRMENGFIQVNSAGTGIMLIQRSVIETLRARFPNLWVDRAPGVFEIVRGRPNGLFQCFAARQNRDGFFSGEDFSFCLRWTEDCRGEIWSCITETITHSGPTTFSGRFEDKIKASSDPG